jgi:hypothetical protein
MARFKKGDRKPPNSGRKKGVRNKIPRALRELVQDVMVDAGVGATPEDRARDYLLKIARKKPALFIALLGKTVERQVNVTADVRETVRLINLTGLDLSDPKIRKRLGPSILGGPLTIERGKHGQGQGGGAADPDRSI